jgi:hypothetical protein
MVLNKALYRLPDPVVIEDGWPYLAVHKLMGDELVMKHGPLMMAGGPLAGRTHDVQHGEERTSRGRPVALQFSPR